MSFLTTLVVPPHRSPSQLAGELRAALGSAKVVHLRGLAEWLPAPEWPPFYEALTEATGHCLHLDEDFAQGSARTGHKWIEVRYDADIPDDAAYRFSKNAQPLHTDESYLSEPAEVMFMHCLVQAPNGGETTFVDADKLWQELQARNPALATRLLDHPVRFAKAGDSRHQPIIAQTPAGWRLNWNYHCVDPNESAENQALAQEFRQFLLDHITNTPAETAILLAPGEAVAWWDDQVLHGRRAFRATATNDRFLLKSGFRLTADV
ncbi:TauD/TfdA family dioxygenase [Hymenobacter sp. BT664]|uniref:TauD/TfdA family dioxygenase n=1 Tax=Hymenobacter montanus TaxID=2771359 RepID=A0A927B9B9_9BACT|nr:TauD/TfdA family dioxygenase [Hymenobacter montanus]MBD2766520.1 TauD/TfdA family dioxygenase [Hymenobacter montanus]